MSIPFSAYTNDRQDQTDIGPLSWVMGEIRDALEHSRRALLDAVAQDAESRATALYHAKSHLHQAHGALQMVDLDGVANVTEAIERLLERLASAEIALTQTHADIVGDAYQALLEYLEHVLSGARQQAVRLYPYHKAILEALGAERIHPADLFFPQLAEPFELPAMAADPIPSVSYPALRQRFEMALLSFLKNSDPLPESGAAAAMRAVVAEIGQAQSMPQARRFWWVLHGFADAVYGGQIASGRFVKQLFALINLQIRHLAQGSCSISESLLRDALFFIAQIEQPSTAIRSIRAAYRIEVPLPADYETRHYGRIDVDALRTAKEGLAQAKSLWSRIAGGDVSLAESFEREMKTLAAASEKLNSPSLAKLLRELNGIARHAAHSSPGHGICLEMATGLLFVEYALNNISHLGTDFSARADALTGRLISIVAGEAPAATAQWLDELSEQAQQRHALGVLASEMQANLRQIEKSLDEYFANPAKLELLQKLEPALHQLAGALSVLDQNDAMRAVEHIQVMVRGFADSLPEAPADRRAYQDVAQNVGALGFFLEMLANNPQAARSHFIFNPQQGIFHASLFEKTAPATPAVARTTAAPAAAEESLQPEQTRAATVEDDLAQHQQQAASLADALLAAPHDVALQQQLKAALHSVRSDAALIDDGALRQRTQSAIDQLAQPGFIATAQALEGVASAAAVAAPAPAVVAAVTASDGEIDAELLEIFISEAQEVLAFVSQTLPQSRQNSHNQEHLASLRRSFHTLKGSGRMVGLQVFGNAAWSIEQVLNLWLAEARNASAALYALLDMAVQEMQAWVAEIKLHGQSGRSGDTLIAAAERVKNGLAPALPAATHEIPVELPGVPDMPEMLDAAALLAELAPAPDCNLDARPEPAAGLPPEMSESLQKPAETCGEEDASASLAPPADAPAPQPAASVIDFSPVTAMQTLPDDTVRKIGNIEVSVPLHTIYLAEADQIVRLLSNDFAEWRHESQRAVSTEAINAAHSLCGSSATVGFRNLHDLARVLETLLQHLARQPVILAVAEFDLLDQSMAHCRAMLQTFALGEMPPMPLAQIRQLESLHRLLRQRRIPTGGMPESAAPPAEAAVPDAPIVPAPRADSGVRPEVGNVHASDPVHLIEDALDADLLPVFVEEGNDLLPEVGRLLRAWQQAPADAAAPQALLRALHTIKGSARMAGAMTLGQHTHDIETRIDQLMQAGTPAMAALDALLASHDHSLNLFEQLQKPSSAAADIADVADTANASAQPAGHALPSAATPLLSPAALQTPLMRVRADIIDRLVNQAGEVSISRSRLEAGVDTLRGSLSELTENVSRLRSQLREIEMQAESQIMSLMPQSGDREFDPLEFDRFTRLQELTRMMAESVSDVASVQQSLTRTAEQASADLGHQARLTRDLQQDLMRVRMVPFASVSERLYRVARQASKEVNKRVSLEISGAAVEIDRSVLEKMAAPFEHLLRNAIAHGIESREQRRVQGKREVGELQVQVQQEGNEVVIRFSDDGQGLDLARIRDKARSIGLLGRESAISDADAMELIFHPGFSTATEVTELAGRGVGMDVVHEEVAVLGGRVAISSVAGQGTCFTIHLPLTLAVTQVVLLEAGDKTYAVPSALVEQIQQLKTQALASAYSDAAIVWQDQRVALHSLSALLADTATVPLVQQYSPLVILRSGSDRVAIHVDKVLGNREVVVKNIGPQLARMAGIVGATVLGSGEIVLILNPVALASRAARIDQGARQLLPTDAPDDGLAAAAELAQPAAGLRRQRIVMVVDDSLTVRRVTQRLLTREGYQVALAKDGVDALQQLQAITPDVMLVDIEMPRMDGFDLTRNVRSDARTRHIPIIMITSRTADKHRNYAMELGVDAYFGKPFQEDALLQAIASHIVPELPADDCVASVS